MNAIETHGLSKSFRSVRAVREVSLTVPAGAVYGLVGKNGAGKSTLLKLVAVLAEELPGLAVRVLPDGALSVAAPAGGEPDRRVLSQTLLAAGIAVTELSSAPPDVEDELVELMSSRSPEPASIKLQTEKDW